MSVKLRLKRLGRSHGAFYRLNAMESRSPRDGRVLEELGVYDPCNKVKESQIKIDVEKCKKWLDNGAIPSETVSTLLKRSGVEHKMLRLPKPGKPKPKVEEVKKA